MAVGTGVGSCVGSAVGTGVGATVGAGVAVGTGVGFGVGSAVGSCVGIAVGAGVAVGMTAGTSGRLPQPEKIRLSKRLIVIRNKTMRFIECLPWGKVDAFMDALGYRHDLENNCYHVERENDQRIALFAHEGVGAAFLSCLLDIPYPMFATHFDMTHTGVTVIGFMGQNDIVLPRVMTFSNDSHLYREGLPTKHQNLYYY